LSLRDGTVRIKIESSNQRVVFANAEHDFPRRIIYGWLTKSLHAKIEGTLGGKAASEEWTW